MDTFAQELGDLQTEEQTPETLERVSLFSAGVALLVENITQNSGSIPPMVTLGTK